MTYDILVTTFKKDEKQIVNLLIENNIFGNILVGNQGNVNFSEKTIVKENRNITIYNLTSLGVSKNRNFLLSKAKSDFVLFLDDDVHILNYDFETELLERSNNAYRFNLSSHNTNRPIKQIHVNKKLKFAELKSFGVWGIFFPREFLIKKRVVFDELIGPGCWINHGEDSLFIKSYLTQGNILQVDKTCFDVLQNESTWQGINRDIRRELISHGYVYGCIFKKAAKFFLFYHLIKNRKLYRSIRFIETVKRAMQGYKLYKLSKNTNLTDNKIKEILFKN